MLETVTNTSLKSLYGVRKGSNFILLQVVDQFSQHHLLKRLSFLHCIFLPPLSKISCPQVRVALSQSLKSGRLIPPVPFFFLRIALAIQDFLYFHTNCEIICSSSLKNTVGNLIGIALNLQIALGSILIFTILILYTVEYYSAIKKNTFESVLMRWMTLEPINQSEVSQKEKHQYSILTHIYGIQKDGNDNPVCERTKETQIYRTVFWTLWERARVG